MNILNIYFNHYILRFYDCRNLIRMTSLDSNKSILQFSKIHTRIPFVILNNFPKMEPNLIGYKIFLKNYEIQEVKPVQLRKNTYYTWLVRF